MASAAESRVRPWRDPKLKWTEEEYIQKRQAIASQTENYNILLCGPAGAGKSAFINTVHSSIRNEVGQIAHSAMTDNLVTKKLRMYRLRENTKGLPIGVTFWDTMGYDDADRGPSLCDIEYLLDGHIKNGYEFNPKDSIDFDSKYFSKTPGLMDKVNVLVLVLDGQHVEEIDVKLKQKLHKIIDKAGERDIRVALIMTKIDRISRSVDDDLIVLHRDEELEKFIEAAHTQFGVNKSNIFPIQNYGPEMHPSLEINILALDTLEYILRLAANTLESWRAASLPQDITVPLLPSAWRSEDLDNLTEKAVQSMRSKRSSIQPTKVPKLRVCLMGPSGGGKSAFINSCVSEVYERIICFADTGCGPNPATTYYREYVLQQGRDGKELDVIMCDTMGVRPSGGLNREDIATVLDGKVPNKTYFNPANPLPRSVTHVSLADRPHVLVLVINGADLKNYSPELIEKMKFVLTTAKERPRELPRVVLVTHIDEVCGLVAEDPTKVFRSQKVKECLNNVEKMLGIPMVDTFPIISIVDDTEIDWRKSALILQALHHLLERAQHYVAQSPDATCQNKGWWWPCEII